MLTHSVFTFLAPALLLSTGIQADGLYSKKSAVLQVDGKSYDKLVAKSNQVSPAYEKAAKGLDGLAQVAAVNCDDDSNKSFCGSMGVQGFPTLKIVKPGKKAGKPVVEDYNGGRTTKDIVDAVKSAIPNNVKRVSDKGLNTWLETSNDTAKAILFSDKGTTSALIKVLATDYLDRIQFAQIRNKEAAANQMFGITSYPTFVVLPGGTDSPVVFDGSFSKSSMKGFLDPYASPSKSKSAPPPKKEQAPLNAEVPPVKEADEAKVEAEPLPIPIVDEEAPSADSSLEEESTPIPTADAASETIEPESQPTASPDPNVVLEEDPKPIPIPNAPPPIPALIERMFLERRCLSPKTTTCILALLPPGSSGDEALDLPLEAATALASLAEIAEKHTERGSKLFPFFNVPNGNDAQGVLRKELGLGEEGMEIVAVNARRGWWRRFNKEEGYGRNAVEGWVDAIRLGEGKKEGLPKVLVVNEEEVKEDHDEL
ncbi:MAG: hypothetical protein Q9220_001317 [cf. Caloplaca sp. 1 TL-2023]